MGYKASVNVRFSKSLFILSALAVTSVAHAQFSIGGGTFLPRDARVRDVFGSNTFAWGPGFGPVDRAGRQGFGFDGTGLIMNATNNRFFALGGTYGFEWQSAKPDTSQVYYARVGTGLAYYDYSINAVGVGLFSGNRFSSITTAEAGIVFNRRLTLSAQYMEMPKLSGVDFSGLRLQLNFAIK